MSLWLFLALSALATWPARQQSQNAETSDVVEQWVLRAEEWPAGVVERSRLSAEDSYSYDFENVDLSQVRKWLKWFNIPIPEADGKVSGWVWVKPQGGWLEWGNYLVEAQLDSPLLKIDAWNFRSAKLRVGFRENTWYLGTLQGSLLDPTSDQIAELKIVGQLPLGDAPELILNGSLDQVQVNALLAAFELDIPVANADGRLEVRAKSKLTSLMDLSGWQAIGSLALEQLIIESTTAGDILADFTLADGQWRLTDGSWRLGGDESASFQANGMLNSGLPFQVLAQAKDFRISQIDRQFLESMLASPSAFDGRLSLDAKLSGTANQGVSRLDADLELSDLRYNQTALGQLVAKVQIGPAAQPDIASNDLPNGENVHQPPSAKLQIGYRMDAETKLDGLAYWPNYLEVARTLPHQLSVDAWGVNLRQDISQKLALLREALPDIQLTSEQLQFLRQIDGRLDAQLRLGNLQTTHDNLDWSCESRVRILGLSLAGASLGDNFFQLSKEPNSSQITMRLWDRAEQLALQADIKLKADSTSLQEQFSKLDYQAQLELNQFSTRIQASPAASAFSLNASGQASIQGNLDAYLNEGSFNFPSVALENKNGNKLELCDVIGTIDPNVVQLKQFTLLGKSGRLDGQAEWQRQNVGQHRLHLTANQLSAWELLADEAGLAGYGWDGSLSFKLQASKPAEVQSLLQSWQVKFDGRLEQMELLQRKLGDAAFQGDFTNERIALMLSGDLLEGKLSADLDAQLQDPDQTNKADIHTQVDSWSMNLTWADLNLNEAIQLAAEPTAVPEVAGKASVQLQLSGQANQSPQGQIRLLVPNMQVANRRLVESLEIEGDLRENRIRIQQGIARIAGGRLHLAGELGTRNNTPDGDMQVAIQGLDLSKVSHLAGPNPMAQLDGAVSFRGKIRLDSKMHLDGTLDASDVAWNGLSAARVRGSLRSQYDWKSNRFDSQLRDLHGTALGGNLRGELELNASTRWSMKSSLSLQRGHMDELSQALGFQRVVGTGRFDASAKLSSRDLQKLNYLSGPVNFDFQGGDVASFPVLGDVQNLLLLPQLPSVRIQGGYLRGQLGQGQFRINELFLGSNAYWILAAGSTSLQNQKLDLNAVLQTDDSLGMSEFARWSSEKLLLVVAPQLALLVELNELVRNRTLYLHIGGTPKYPVIQPQAAQTLAANLIAQLQRRLLASPTAGTVPIDDP